MQLTETVKLYPNKYQTELIKATMTEYISTVNHLVLDAINVFEMPNPVRKYNKALRNSDN